MKPERAPEVSVPARACAPRGVPMLKSNPLDRFARLSRSHLTPSTDNVSLRPPRSHHHVPMVAGIEDAHQFNAHAVYGGAIEVRNMSPV